MQCKICLIWKLKELSVLKKFEYYIASSILNLVNVCTTFLLHTICTTNSSSEFVQFENWRSSMSLKILILCGHFNFEFRQILYTTFLLHLISTIRKVLYKICLVNFFMRHERFFNIIFFTLVILKLGLRVIGPFWKKTLN